MELPVFFVFTHDAMGDGEDGPTHQPVEQLASLRAIPGLVTLRPGDANEVVEAYRYIMQLAPSARRVGLVAPAPADSGPEQVRSRLRGGERRLRACRRARRKARGHSHRLRKRSQPRRRGPREAGWPKASVREWSPCRPGISSSTRRKSTERASCLPSVTARVAVEQASTFGWERYVGIDGPRDRNADIRGVGASQGTAEEIWL